MRIGNFGVLIPDRPERGSGHVEMEHNSVYTIRLINHWHDRRCDAQVSVDGKDIGTLRLEKSGCLTLETPPHDSNKGRFTFVKADSKEWVDGDGASVAAEDRGLVQVTFKPERPQRVLRMERLQFASEHKDSYGRLSSDKGMECDFAPGGTVLTGQSSQSFCDVAPLDYELGQEVTISLRLVCTAGSAVRPLKEVSPRSNPVPAPVS